MVTAVMSPALDHPRVLMHDDVVLYSLLHHPCRLQHQTPCSTWPVEQLAASDCEQTIPVYLYAHEL